MGAVGLIDNVRTVEGAMIYEQNKMNSLDKIIIYWTFYALQTVRRHWDTLPRLDHTELHT